MRNLNTFLVERVICASGRGFLAIPPSEEDDDDDDEEEEVEEEEEEEGEDTEVDEAG